MSGESEVERLLRLREEADAGRRDVAARRERRLMGEGVPEWTLPPESARATPRAREGAPDAALRLAIQREVGRQLEQLVDRRIAVALDKFAGAVGVAMAKRDEARLADVRTLIRAEVAVTVTRAMEETAESVPAPPLRRIA